METTREQLQSILKEVNIVYEALLHRLEHPEEASDDPTDPLNHPHETMAYLKKVLEHINHKLDHFPGRERLN